MYRNNCIFLLLCVFRLTISKLVVDNVEELTPNGEVDSERLQKEGELIETEYEQVEGCEHSKIKIDTYRFYVRNEKGEEEEDLWSLGSRINNVDIKTIEFQSIDQTEKEFITVKFRYYLDCMKPDDPALIETLKTEIMQPPNDLGYNLKEKSMIGEFGQGLLLNTVIYKENVKNGFFMEVGAGDFELNSNTVFLEMKENWEGLLLEPHPLQYRKGIDTNRKVWSANSCVENKFLSQNESVQCFPLHSWILAADRTINYLALFATVEAIKAVPWDKVDVEVISVETHFSEIVYEGNKQQTRDFMKEQGYILVEDLLFQEDVYIRKDKYEGDYKPDQDAWNMLKRLDHEKIIKEDYKDLKKDNLFSYIQYVPKVEL